MGIIKILPPEAARLIAAGEVIDRPAAVLRELLDNALDAGASEALVEIQGGGIDSIRVSDDGRGMDEDDLLLSAMPHATSKISSADDLLKATTLGFRGEALSSIAAAARLEISSRDEASQTAKRLVAGPGIQSHIEAIPGRRGTVVHVSRIFENFPARRRFLKRAQAEASLCRQVFIEKALAHPGVSFRFSSEGKIGLVLAPTDRAGRVSDCHAEAPRGLIYGLRFSGQGFSGEAVIAGPAFYRNDRRLLQVYVNRRRVQDYGLISALDYGFEGFLPGGAHPYAFLFLEIDPALADFNIHPAKREVRLKDPEIPRRALVSAIKDFLSALVRREPLADSPDFSGTVGTASLVEENASQELRFGSTSGGISNYGRGNATGRSSTTATNSGYEIPEPRSWEAFDAARARAVESTASRASVDESANASVKGYGTETANARVRYLGKALGLFLLAEKENALYLVDQHAAHERILFDELSAAPPAVQELLVSEFYEPEDDAEARTLERMMPELALAGFKLELVGGGFSLESAPVLLRGAPLEALKELVKGGGKDLARAARALAACKAAVKDGDELDRESAAELAARALALPEPRCPHGRPIFVRITRDELFRMVRRIV